MTRTCTVCRNENREQIDKELVEGRPYRSIARQSGASPSAVLRHKNEHLPLALVQAKEAHGLEHGESLLVRIRRLSAEKLEILAGAKRYKDRETQLKAIAHALKNLELEGKLLGELGKAKSQPSKQQHLHLHGNDAVRAFVLATRRLPSREEMARLTGREETDSSSESVKEADNHK